MRTTIEIPDDQRAALLELAARRGQKGFSRIIQEALARYLEQEGQRTEKIRLALTLQGSLQGSEADTFADTVARSREMWR